MKVLLSMEELEMKHQCVGIILLSPFMEIMHLLNEMNKRHIWQKYDQGLTFTLIID